MRSKRWLAIIFFFIAITFADNNNNNNNTDTVQRRFFNFLPSTEAKCTIKTLISKCCATLDTGIISKAAVCGIFEIVNKTVNASITLGTNKLGNFTIGNYGKTCLGTPIIPALQLCLTTNAEKQEKNYTKMCNEVEARTFFLPVYTIAIPCLGYRDFKFILKD